jgi:hypothetical protein
LVTFRLSADKTGESGSSKYSSFCELSILINAPPSGGTFSVRPNTGDALTTLFTLLAPSWSDEVEDLPLLFSFSYRVSILSPILQLQARKGTTTVSTVLPPGLLSNDFAITATAVIFDTPGASVNMSVDAISNPVEIDYLEYLRTFIDATGSSVIDTSVASATINNVASTLSVVNCSSITAGYCASLNREPCVNTPNTCGTCLSGYIGIIGDINKLCYTPAAASRLRQVNETCSKNSECLYDACVNGYCLAPPLDCPSNDATLICSGHGICGYTDPAGRVLDSCTQLDTKCTAACECIGGYGGSDCSFDNVTLAARDETRSLMCQYFITIAENSNLSPLLMDTFVGTVVSAYDPTQASNATAAYCFTALSYLTDYAANGGLVGTKKATADFLLSAAGQFVKPGGNSSALTDSMSQISNGVILSMSDGQEPIGITSGGMRMQVVKSQASTVSALEPPRSAAEEAYGQPAGSGMEMSPGSASGCDSGGGYVSISVVQWSASPFPGADVLETPQMKFESKVSDAVVQRRRRAQAADDDNPYAGQTPSYYISFQFNARKNFDPNIDFVKSSPLELSNATFPDCSFYDPVSGEFKPCEGCRISSYTNYNVTYGCYDIGQVCGGSSGDVRNRLRRYLSADDDDDADDDGGDDTGFGSEQTSITSINFGALLTTFTGVLGQNPLAINFAQAKTIISFVICLVFTMIFGCWYFRRWDIEDRYIFVYNKADPRIKLHKDIAAQSMKVPAPLSMNFHMDMDLDMGLPMVDDMSAFSDDSDLEEDFADENPMAIGDSHGFSKTSMKSFSSPKRFHQFARHKSMKSMQKLQRSKHGSRIRKLFTRLANNVSRAATGAASLMSAAMAEEGSLKKVKYDAVGDDLGYADEELRRTGMVNDVITAYINTVMPDERTYSEHTSWYDVGIILLMQHPYTVMFYGPSLQKTRMLRWNQLVIGTLLGLFVDTLFFSTFFPDTGECETYTSEELCILPVNSALGTPLCTWKKNKKVTNGGSCSLTPPPSDMTFTMILVMLTVIICVPLSFLFDFVMESYCKYRPDFSKWGYKNEEVLGRNTQSAATFNKEELNSTVRILRDNLDRVKREEAQAYTGAKLAEYEKGLADKAKRDLKKFNHESPKTFAEFDTPDNEAILLLQAAKKYLDDNAMKNDLPWNSTGTSSAVDEKVAAIQNYLGIYHDGSPMPLTTWDWYWYGDSKNKLVTMIDEARGGAEEIKDALLELGKTEMASREVALIQFFMAEHFSPYKRYILNGQMFSFNNSSALPVHPGKWIAAWSFVFAMEAFFVYWMLMWGVSSGGKTMKAWGLNFAVGAIQDIFCIAPLRIIIIYVIAMTSIKPQLRYMHRVLHIIAMNYVQDKLPDNYEEIKVVQHFSPACRAARLHVAADLAAGEILRALDDKDANDCNRGSDLGLSTIAIMFVAIPIIIGVLTETGGEIALDTALPSFLSMFILANYLMYQASILLLILPYVSIIGFIVIRRYFFTPALQRVRKVRAEKIRRNATFSRSDLQGWNVALRSTPITDILWQKFSTSMINYAAFTIYYLGIIRIVRKKIDEYMNNAEEEAVQAQWKIMNLPLQMQGRIFETGTGAKEGVLKQPSGHTVPRVLLVLPRSRRRAAKDPLHLPPTDDGRPSVQPESPGRANAHGGVLDASAGRVSRPRARARPCDDACGSSALLPAVWVSPLRCSKEVHHRAVRQVDR